MKETKNWEVQGMKGNKESRSPRNERNKELGSPRNERNKELGSPRNEGK